MTEEPMAVPAIRTWRDIPQPVKPRAMSRGGRWRRAKQALRGGTLVLALVSLAVGIWWMVDLLGPAPRHMPEGARAVPVRRLELRTSSGGVLDGAWLERTLALPHEVALMELDLEVLRARLLADRQVITAGIARQFPDRLVVTVTERVPVARLRVEMAGQPRDLLVAPDGVIFPGAGFDVALLASLPWLAGVNLVAEGAGFRPIAGMQSVAQLLADAQLSAQRLYQSWLSVSLARLESDRELEVTTKNGTTIVFSAAGEFFVQLAKLDYLLDRLADTPMVRARIDLTLGRNVPVRIEPPPPADGRSGTAAPSHSPSSTPPSSSAKPT